MKPLTLGVVGIDHRHIYGQLQGMMELGCTCNGWWTEGEPQPVEGFVKRFPDVPRVADRQALLDDPANEGRILLATKFLMTGKEKNPVQLPSYTRPFSTHLFPFFFFLCNLFIFVNISR